MAGFLTREGLNFLFRSEEGTVDARTWRLGVILLASILFVLTLIWLALRPWAGRGLDERALIDGRTIAAYVYLAFFVFALLIIAASYVNLSAKRFRTRGRTGAGPAALAGFPLVMLFLVGAAYWLNAQVADAVPNWVVAALALVCAASLFWHVIELGLRPDGPAN